MIRGAVRLTRGTLGLPLPWRVWVFTLFVLNALVPLFFLGHAEARLVLGTMVLAAVIMMVLADIQGFTRLLGLAHFPWIALLVLLVPRLGSIPNDEPFGWWLRVTLGLNAVSLVIDVTDVIRYLRGERAETV